MKGFIGKLFLLAVVVCVAGYWAYSRNQGEGPVVSSANGSSISGSSESTSAADPLRFAPAPRMPLLVGEETYHGLAWQIHNSEHAVHEAGIVLNQIADVGADTVLISNAGYQEHAGSETFQIDPKVTPSHEQWMEIFEIAHDNGLRVVLMPIILLSDPRGNEWRGVINPPSWDDWMEQYEQFLLHFARIAAAGDVEVMTIGSELVSAEKYVHVDQWRGLIQSVRRVFPGKLSYSANWDHYKMVRFWSELDLIGMTSYYKLADEPNPTVDELVEEWKPIKRGILRWQEKIGKPILFTEVGWCSQEGASIEPWNYYRSQHATRAGLEEQKNNYIAFIETWHDQVLRPDPTVGGIIWWEWPKVEGGPEDFNYTPKGKPAEKILREFFEEVREYRGGASSTKPGN